MTIEVRTARPDELGAVGVLCEGAYRAAGQLRHDDPYAQTLRDAAERARTCDVLVAVDDDPPPSTPAIVGTVTICPVGSPFGEIGLEGESEFRFLAVDEAAWGRGVGEILVAACTQRAAERGQTAHVISVNATNTAAQRLYGRLGFTRLPERDWTPVPGVHLLAFTRPIPGDAAQE